MQKIITHLWFDDQAEEAMDFYVSVFKSSPMKNGADSRIVSIKRYPDNMQVGPMTDMAGKVLTGVFELAGQRFMALDGGPMFKFNESVSLLIDCEKQEEIDHFWNALSAVPEAEQCGWVKDKFGLSWQINAKALGELMAAPDAEKSARVMQAMLQMKKLDIAALEEAYAG